MRIARVGALAVVSLSWACGGDAPRLDAGHAAVVAPGPIDPGHAPTWALPQEARAPKMPDAEKRWRTLEAPSVADLDDGLLVCSAQIAAKNDPTHFPWGGWHPPTEGSKEGKLVTTGGDWDSLNGPDALIRFRFGTRPAIELWGPEDHWAMFVSIPRVTLHRGDVVKVDVWDRDVTSSEYISTIEVPFDGQFPMKLEAKWLRFDCRGVDPARVHAWAEPWAQRLDKALAEIEAAQPDDRALLFGTPPDIDGLKSSLRIFSDASFRYYAGYLGWDAPEVVTRLERFQTDEAAWQARLHVKLAALEATSTPLGRAGDSGRGWTMTVSARGPEDWVLAFGTAAPPTCKTSPYDGAEVGGLALQIIDDDGTTRPFRLAALDAADKPTPCDGSPVARLLLSGLSPKARLLRLEQKNALRYYRLR